MGRACADSSPGHPMVTRPRLLAYPLAHVAVLVLLAAATGAGVVAADARAAVADRFRLLVAAGRVRALPIRRRCLHPWRRVVDRGPDLPQGLVEPFLFFHAEDRVRDLVLHALPHGVELFHALPFVLRLRIDLGVAYEADARAQVVHRVEVVLPGGVQDAEHEAA